MMSGLKINRTSIKSYSLTIDENGNQVKTLVNEIPNKPVRGKHKCPECGAILTERQDRYTDGEYARSVSIGCPNYCGIVGEGE
jgi:ribosomal protein S27AE